MANGKIWRAYCASCECVTDLEKTDTPKEGICTECGTLQTVVDNPVILKRLRELSALKETHFANALRVQDEIDLLSRHLAPMEVTPKPKWERLTMEMACRLCDRKTRWAFSGIPQCHVKCKPRPGKVGIDDIPEEVIAMIREYLGGNNEDDDFEVMRFQTPEAS